jgi:hypothetical protein
MPGREQLPTHPEGREGRRGPAGQQPPPRPPEGGPTHPGPREKDRWEGYDLEVLNDLLDS